MTGLLSKRSRQLSRLAQEQATFRRLGALVARGAPPAELFAALADELGRLLPGDRAALGRYGPDGTVTPVAAWGRRHGCDLDDAGQLLTTGDLASAVFATRSPSRVDTDGAVEALGSRVAAPVAVDGRPWGVMVACATGNKPLPTDAEARLSEFAELIATLVANAGSRAALAASRARIVTASDEARRRIERDLHDGAQQRLVSLALELRAAQAAVPPELGQLRDELSRVADGIVDLLEELRTIAHGIHPAILDTGGLGPALKTLARRSPVPVQIQVRTRERLPERTEVAAYYVVSETLANVTKHAQASLAHVEVETQGGALRVAVRDDGVGGADSARGSGLVGLKDRVETLGGSLTLHSPPGEGTSVEVELPLGKPQAG